MTPDTLRSANDVSAYANWLFGRPIKSRRGVIHVVSVESEGQTLVVMRIRDDTPRNLHDACMLRMARARADAILTTGKVLRDEPDLRHELSGSAADDGVLRAWGDRIRGRQTRRVSIVLTGGAAFAPDHPLLDGSTQVAIVCPHDQANSLRERFAGCGVHVVGLEDPTVSAAVRFAHGEFGAETVSIEAGPTTVRPLYGRADGPNELMLAEFKGRVPHAVRGGRLVDRHTLADLMGPLHYGPTIPAADGSWRFAWLERRSMQDG